MVHANRRRRPQIHLAQAVSLTSSIDGIQPDGVLYVLVRGSSRHQRQATPLPDRPMAPVPQRLRCGDGCGHSAVIYNVRSRPRKTPQRGNLVTRAGRDIPTGGPLGSTDTQVGDGRSSPRCFFLNGSAYCQCRHATSNTPHLAFSLRGDPLQHREHRTLRKSKRHHHFASG